ncbi:hypothetical protein PRIPAC_85419 [Pristionchus pacificus]|uniref:Uncharacterized protein n=1 Tax=Pristionchus pacificus TaxID=54126 RepID=A0A2A6BL11_PRIPA|nr:hypothetical protein PRIPAC_85419 [Pristionchus pacificus]|eukprot:PDM66496.1 hypothetical protein PRIPAC_47913 [Pristionchus pacificus]
MKRRRPVFRTLSSKYGSPSLHFTHSLTGQRGERVCEMERRRPKKGTVVTVSLSYPYHAPTVLTYRHCLSRVFPSISSDCLVLHWNRTFSCDPDASPPVSSSPTVGMGYVTHRFDVFHSSGRANRRRRDVRVAAGAVPLAHRDLNKGDVS